MSIQEGKLTEIAEAIRAKKGTSENIAANDFAEEILSIPSGSADIDVSFTKIQFPTELQGATGVTSFKTSTGNYFISSNVTNSGIWYLDVTTKTLAQIRNTGNSFVNWFEDSAGNVYTSSSTSASAGIYKTTPTTTAQIFSLTQANWQYWYEHMGYIYCSSSTTNAGVAVINIATGVVTQPITTSYNWRYFNGVSSGTVYAGSSTSSTGLYAITNGGTTATQVITTGANWRYVYGSKDGRAFVSSTSVSGIYLVTTSSNTKIFNDWTGFANFYEFDTPSAFSNKIYASCTGDATGVVVINSDNTVSSASSSVSANSGGYTQVKVSVNDDLYFFGNNGGGTGTVLKIANTAPTTATNLTGNTSKYFDIVTDSLGNFYMISSNDASTTHGIFMININSSTNAVLIVFNHYNDFISLKIDGTNLIAVDTDNMEYTFDISNPNSDYPVLIGIKKLSGFLDTSISLKDTLPIFTPLIGSKEFIVF